MLLRIGNLNTFQTAHKSIVANSHTAGAQLAKHGIKGAVNIPTGSQEYVVD